MITNHDLIPVEYTSYACEISLHLVVPKRTFLKPYFNLVKPFSSIIWGAIMGTIVLVLVVRFKYEYFKIINMLNGESAIIVMGTFEGAH